MSRFNDLFQLFEQTVLKRVALSNHLIYPSFHTLVSPFLLKHRFVFADRKIVPMVHSLHIQNKGSGKGEIQKLVKNILIKARKNAKVVNSFTSAGIIGSIIPLKNNTTQQIKKLQGVDYIAIDEGSQITNEKNQHARTLKLELNGYLDTNEVTKCMQRGDLNYLAYAVFSIGTYLESTIKISFIQDGFFDRFLISAKIFSRQELKNLRQQIDEIATKENAMIIRDNIAKICRLLNEIELENGKEYYLSNDNVNYYYLKFEEMVNNFFIDDNLNFTIISIFEESLARLKSNGHRIMTQYAIINGDDAITDDAIDYTIKVLTFHLKSYILLLQQCKGLPNTNTRNNIKEITITLLKDIIKANLDFSKKKFKDILYSQYPFPRGFGLRRIIENQPNQKSLLNEMIDANQIKIIETRGNEQILQVVE
jgi:hypothetical protein